MASVGIFWFVPSIGGRSRIVFDRTPLDQATPYGDCLTHEEGHSEFWERTGRLSIGEYDEFPRGRVVYDMSAGEFFLFADRRLHGNAFVKVIRDAFGLPTHGVRVRSDQHYARSRKVRPPEIGPI